MGFVFSFVTKYLFFSVSSLIRNLIGCSRVFNVVGRTRSLCRSQYVAKCLPNFPSFLSDKMPSWFQSLGRIRQTTHLTSTFRITSNNTLKGLMKNYRFNSEDFTHKLRCIERQNGPKITFFRNTEMCQMYFTTRSSYMEQKTCENVGAYESIHSHALCNSNLLSHLSFYFYFIFTLGKILFRSVYLTILQSCYVFFLTS